MQIPVNKFTLGNLEKELVMECLDSTWISSEGPSVLLFEQKIANLVDRDHGVAVTNGTAALDLAIQTLNIGPGDEVIVPSFTIISCIHQILRSGAVPVFVDSDSINWNMDISLVEGKITPKTKAVMAVHIYGLPVDMDPLVSLCDKYSLFLIEDSAESIGQTYKGSPCGSFGDLSTFSFYPNKHITTGEGGMLVTNNPDMFSRAKYYRNLCFDTERRFRHADLGWNLRMTSLQAALGLAQAELIDATMLQKRNIGLRYQQNLKSNTNLQMPLDATSYAKNCYWVFGVLVKKASGRSPEELAVFLRDKGVGTRPFFYPLNIQPVLQKFSIPLIADCPVSQNLAETGIYFPSGLATTNEEIDYVCDCINEFFGERL